MSHLEIRFQEAVLAECDRLGADANNLTDEDWMTAYDNLSEGNFSNLVIDMGRMASF